MAQRQVNNKTVNNPTQMGRHAQSSRRQHTSHIAAFKLISCLGQWLTYALVEPQGRTREMCNHNAVMGAQTAVHACTGHADITVHKHMDCMRQHSKSVSCEHSLHHGRAGVVSNVWWLSHLDARLKPNHGELSTKGCVCILCIKLSKAGLRRCEQRQNSNT